METSFNATIERSIRLQYKFCWTFECWRIGSTTSSLLLMPPTWLHCLWISGLYFIERKVILILKNSYFPLSLLLAVSCLYILMAFRTCQAAFGEAECCHIEMQGRNFSAYHWCTFEQRFCYIIFCFRDRTYQNVETFYGFLYFAAIWTVQGHPSR